jgi:hypothetical protein
MIPFQWKIKGTNSNNSSLDYVYRSLKKATIYMISLLNDE